MIPKKHKLLGLFDEVGTEHPVGLVLDVTDMKSLGSLKTVMWELRKQKIINLRQKFGFIKRGEL